MNRINVYFRNSWKALILLSCIIPQLYSMDSNNSMKTPRNNTYNATTLFGDSEPLGIIGKKQRTFAKSHETIIQQHNDIIKPLEMLSTDLNQELLTNRNLSQSNREILQKLLAFNEVSKNTIIRMSHAELGQNNQFYKTSTSRREILNNLAISLNTLEKTEFFLKKKNINDDTLSQALNQIIAVHEREQFIYTQLEELNLPDNIGVVCIINQKNTGSAILNGFNNHEYIDLSYSTNYPLFAIKRTGLHEIGHIYYGDNKDMISKYKRAPNVALAQVTAPFISYFASCALLRYTKLHRAALPLGILAGLSNYALNCAYTYKRSRDIELRADTFAIKKLLRDKQFMPLYDTIFDALEREDRYRSNWETRIRSVLGTHPQPVKRALNCIKLLEENGTPFNKEQVEEYLKHIQPYYTAEKKIHMHKYLPPELLKKAGIVQE